MEKDFNTGLRRSLEADRIKLTRRRKQLLRDMGLSEDLDSTELAEKLHEQVRANDVLNRNLIRSDEEIAQSRKEIAQYKAENTSLRERIAELESKLGTKPIAKTKLKVSGCFRTEAGAQNYATVASVIQTAVKNGQNPFEVLRVIATLALT